MVIAGLWAIRKDKQKRSEIIEQTKTTRLFTYLTIVTWAVAIFIILSSFTGYIALGEFLSQSFCLVLW
jgi:small-conductance mechanosensitive channel